MSEPSSTPCHVFLPLRKIKKLEKTGDSEILVLKDSVIYILNRFSLNCQTRVTQAA